MSNLLVSEFSRLLKSRIFHWCNLFMSGFAVFVLYTRWKEIRMYPDIADESPDGLLLMGAFYISLVIAVFIGAFIGTEYKDGTIRNKLAIGHSRTAIYFSNLFVCTAASLVMHIVGLVIIIVGGLLLIGNFKMSVGNMAALILTSFFTMASFAAIFLLVCMLITSKSTGSVTAIILALILMVSASHIYFRLEEQEYIEPYRYSIFDEDGNSVDIEQALVKNPNYLEGIQRKLFEFLNDLLPNNQIFQLSNGGSVNLLEDDGEVPDHSAWLPLYSLAIIIMTTAAGIFVFRKKDLK